MNDKQKISLYEQQLDQYRQEIYNLNFVLDSLDANVYWKDIDGVYLGCNKSVFKAANKTSKEDIIGKTDIDGNFPWSQQVLEALKNDKKVISLGEAVNVEESYDDKVIYLATKSPLKDDKNKIIGMVGVSIDITDRIKLQQDVVNKNIELQSKDQLKKDFIKNFSHDVKLPINGIIGNAKFVKILSKDQPTLKKAVGKLDDGIMSLSVMFDKLYNAMVNEEFDDVIHNEDFNFNDLIDLEIALARTSVIPDKDLSVSFFIDDKMPTMLYGDYFKISQILRNLLGNSVKYTSKGEVKLTAKITENTTDNIKIKFTVSDTGTGITTTDKNKVYEYGRRFITSYGSNISGAGIGLYMVKKHVETLGGTVDFDTDVGKGTQFFIEIPFKKIENTR